MSKIRNIIQGAALGAALLSTPAAEKAKAVDFSKFCCNVGDYTKIDNVEGEIVWNGVYDSTSQTGGLTLLPFALFPGSVNSAFFNVSENIDNLILNTTLSTTGVELYKNVNIPGFGDFDYFATGWEPQQGAGAIDIFYDVVPVSGARVGFDDFLSGNSLGKYQATYGNGFLDLQGGQQHVGQGTEVPGVPEPSTGLLLGGALAAGYALNRRRKQE